MKLRKTAVMFAVTAAIAGAQLGASTAAYASAENHEVVRTLRSEGMVRSDGMVTKADFLRVMAQRFDAMDKKRLGMLSMEDIARVLDPNSIPRG